MPRQPAPSPWTAAWIWHEGMPQRSDLGHIVTCHFRREFEVKPSAAVLTVYVSAESRYKLYLNGKAIGNGPCKSGSKHQRFYETYELGPRLRRGKNVISATVVHYPNLTLSFHQPFGPMSQLRDPSAGFLLQGTLRQKNRPALELDSGPLWQCRKDMSVTMQGGNCAGPNEIVDGAQFPHGFGSPKYDARSWKNAVTVAKATDIEWEPNWGNAEYIGQLRPRPIPMLFEKPRRFVGVKRASGYAAACQDLVIKGRPLKFPAGSRTSFEIDAGELTTGFIEIATRGGRGSVLKLTYAEAYGRKIQKHGKERIIRGVRDEARGAELFGENDEYRVGGKARETYEPFLWRTFRFIKVDVVVGAEDLQLGRLAYRETGYPLGKTGAFSCSDMKLNKIWDISVRTLQRCMHETHEDCPYYEQLSYAMDSRLQMLFSYQLGADDRLARRTIEDFYSTRMPNGLLECRAPSAAPSVIPGFSLHWILMLDDHYMYFGDKELLRRYLPGVESVLAWFKRRVEPEGLVGSLGYWAFMDWVEEWQVPDLPGGVPPANWQGPATIFSLFYAYSLKRAAVLADAVGRQDAAKEYRQQAESLVAAVRLRCFDKKRGYFQDGPGLQEYSQHPQVWAVLAGAVTGADAVELLKKTLADKKIPQMTWSIAHFFFKAFKQANYYEGSADLWKLWTQFLPQNVTTWPEDAVNFRSECHAWGSNPIFEMSAEVLGVKPLSPGYAKAFIQPQTGKLSSAQGSVATRHGAVKVAWTKRAGRFKVKVTTPKGLPAELCLPDKSRHQLAGGSTVQLQCRA